MALLLDLLPLIGGGSPGGDTHYRTLCAELNRLANGGEDYPASFQDEQGAANKWAGTSGLGILAALNHKAGNSTSGSWRDLNAVCNQLAGTNGLEATPALSQVAS